MVVRVELAAGAGVADRSYSIRIGTGVLDEVGTCLREARATQAIVISDRAVVRPHAERVAESLAAAGVPHDLLEVPSGEASKSSSEATRLWKAFAQRAVDRRAHVVAVGGGVVGDLAGFVAATYVRGVSVWQVPTTLVAQVDSAIGGKTGINLPDGKNLVGCFWQPRGVFSDVDTLETLPEREFRSGLAEVVKYGVIRDEAFFAWLEDQTTSILARETDTLTRLIQVSSLHKAAVVSEDEYEQTGLRAILNYGHTFAHAFESATGYGRLLHGEAVSLGMAAAARLALLLGRVDEAFVRRQDALLTSFGLPINLLTVTEEHPPQALIDIMRRDKKTIGGNLRFVLPSRMGAVELVEQVDFSTVARVLSGKA
jgi:3-dehydroquinate synthase